MTFEITVQEFVEKQYGNYINQGFLEVSELDGTQVIDVKPNTDGLSHEYVIYMVDGSVYASGSAILNATWTTTLNTAYEAWKLNNIWLAISESLDDTFGLYENFNDFCISYGCKMIQCCNGVGLYHGGSNHFYIVYKNRVVRAYGYHGENVYKQLSTNPDAFIASYENLIDTIKHLTED